LKDDEGDDGARADDSDEADAEDDEESSQWRKERHERELFMNKKNETVSCFAIFLNSVSWIGWCT
jgi:hypothetical protein